MRTSIVRDMNLSVSFPESTGERVHMNKVSIGTGAGKYQSIVDLILTELKHDSHAYLMVDESPVVQGISHRRPGIHIDGYWVEGSGHTGHRGHRGVRNAGHKPGTGHRPKASSWNTSTFDEDEAIVLVSNVVGCRAFEGNWKGFIGEGGDCSEADISQTSPIVMQENKVYIGNVTMLHESIPVNKSGIRQMMRLNIPGLKIAA